MSLSWQAFGRESGDLLASGNGAPTAAHILELAAGADEAVSVDFEVTA